MKHIVLPYGAPHHEARMRQGFAIVPMSQGLQMTGRACVCVNMTVYVCVCVTYLRKVLHQF